jgi:hypothetical protein
LRSVETGFHSHEHVGLEGVAEYVEVRSGPMSNTPICSVTIKKLEDYSGLSSEWATEGIGVGLITDRVKV